MADITTPILARKTEEFTTSQIELIRNSLAIADNPILLDRTYIVFDAIAGSNSLHLDTGGVTSYSINKGEGGLPTNYNDTGGTKILNYTNTGRYLITIIGTFNGLKVTGTQPGRDKYISVMGGSNYPTDIPVQGFLDCVNLESVIFPLIILTNSNSFDGCLKLKDIYFPVLVTVGQASFSGCISLEKADLPLAVLSFGGVFAGCSKLKEISLPVTLIIANSFTNCVELEKVNVPLVTSLTTSAFNGCLVLKEIDIRLVTNISQDAFNGCVKLQKIHLKGDVSISATSTFSNVVLTDVFVDGTEAQAITIQDDIITAGGLFTTSSRLIYGSQNVAIFAYAANKTENETFQKNLIVTKFFQPGVSQEGNIVTGVMSITGSSVRIRGEGLVADTVNNITSSASIDTILILRSVSEVITVSETGNLKLGATRVLSSPDDRLVLQWNGTNWVELSFSDNT